MKNSICIKAKEGRIKVNIKAIFIGDDICFIITGGKKHIGNIRLFENGEKSGELIIQNHKDHLASQIFEDNASEHLKMNYCIISGLHFDKISTNEIKTALKLVKVCTNKMCKLITKRKF